jgi:hypothetical protein
MGTRFAIYTADIVGASGTTTFNQLHGAGVGMGQNVDEEFTGGSIDRNVSILAEAESKAYLETKDLLKLLTDVSLTAGLKCTEGALFRGRRRDDSGTFSGSNDHLVAASAEGFFCITSLNCRQGVAAEARCEYWALYDGETKPFTLSVSANASGATAPAVNTKYYLGPVKINGTALTDVQSVEIIPGLDVRWIKGDGDVFPRKLAIYLRRPTIRINFTSPQNLNTLGALYLVEKTNVDVFLRKGATGDAGRVPDTDANHIRIRASSAAAKPEDFTGQGNDDYTTGVTILPTGTISSALTEAISS